MKQITLQTESINPDDPTDQPAPAGIVETHWLRDSVREAISFAEQAASDALGKRWVAPEDRDFTDRPPPGAPTMAVPKPTSTTDAVAALLKKRRRAA